MSRAAAIAALSWMHDSGLDVLVGDEPRDWLAAERPAPESPLRAAPLTTSVQDAATPVLPASAATAAARGAADIDALAAAIASYEGVAIRAGATQSVFIDGNRQANALLIGEAPGVEEDRQGKPFVGAAGQLLDRMLAAIGRDRDSVLISNVCFWRPPANRTPNDVELAHCLPFVLRLIELMQPAAILTLGATPTKALLGGNDGINRMRGQWRTLDVAGRQVPVLPTFHPAYLLRMPAQKRLAWADLLAFKSRIDG